MNESEAVGIGSVWTASPVDVNQLLIEDAAAREIPGTVHRLAVPFALALGPASAGRWESRADGSSTWRLELRSSGALWLSIGFGTFRLAPGAELWIRGRVDGTEVGPFDTASAASNGTLWIPPIAGDAVELRLEWPAYVDRASADLVIGQLTHGYRPWGEIGRPQPSTTDSLLGSESGFCNVDVNCPLGSDWQQVKLGVVELLIGGGAASCTGSLINNTNLDCHPYILTAWHCYYPPPPGVQIDPTTTVVRLNYEVQGCASGATNSGQMLTNVRFVAGNADTDFMLLELEDPIPGSIAYNFNGWDRRATPAPETWTIHHPTDNPRKINYNADPLLNGQAFGPFHWRVREWEIGTTEPGSSGAPLLDANHRIVGQLHGGLSTCQNNLFDEFGKFNESWAWTPADEPPTGRLREWLDPGGTGLTALDGLDRSFCSNPVPNLALRKAIVRKCALQGATALPGDTFDLDIELLNNGNDSGTGVAGTIALAAPSQPGVTLLRNSASWPDLAPLATSSPVAPYSIRLAPNYTCGTPIRLTLTAAANESPLLQTIPVIVRVGRPSDIAIFEDSMEAGVGPFAVDNPIAEGPPALAANPWAQTTARAHSPTHSWSVADLNGRSDSRLVLTGTAPLPAGSSLRFRHYMNTNQSFDGGRLEYRLGVSGTWVDARPLITRGGYTSTLSSLFQSPLSGQMAWSGDLGSFVEVEVNLASLAGQTVSFRWRFATDSSISGAEEGWFVDDIRLEHTTYDCIRPRSARGADACLSGRPPLPRAGKTGGG